MNFVNHNMKQFYGHRNMRDLPLQPYQNFMSKLADISGQIIRDAYHAIPNIVLKQDQSPVTEIDLAVEMALRAQITENYPTHGIIGEEYDDVNPDAEFVWVLDPIDGTQSFMIGRPIFGTLISLMHQGEPVLGLIDQPITGERWLGVGGGECLYGGDVIHTRACAALSEATLCTTSPDLFDVEQFKQFKTIRGKSRHAIYGGDCYSYGLLARGRVDVVIECGLKLHDFSALAPIIHSAGGIMTDWQGKAITQQSDGNVVVCGDARLHRQILEMLREG